MHHFNTNKRKSHFSHLQLWKWITFLLTVLSTLQSTLSLIEWLVKSVSLFFFWCHWQFSLYHSWKSWTIGSHSKSLHFLSQLFINDVPCIWNHWNDLVFKNWLLLRKNIWYHLRTSPFTNHTLHDDPFHSLFLLLLPLSIYYDVLSFPQRRIFHWILTAGIWHFYAIFGFEFQKQFWSILHLNFQEFFFLQEIIFEFYFCNTFMMESCLVLIFSFAKISIHRNRTLSRVHSSISLPRKARTRRWCLNVISQSRTASQSGTSARMKSSHRRSTRWPTKARSTSSSSAHRESKTPANTSST